MDRPNKKNIFCCQLGNIDGAKNSSYNVECGCVLTTEIKPKENISSLFVQIGFIKYCVNTETIAVS